MKRAIFIGVLLSGAAVSPAMAHAPILDCYVDGDEIACEAGYSDGASAADQVLRVRDEAHRLLFEARFDTSGSYRFAPPDADEYHVQFEGDQFHSVILYSTDIE
jgi:hypothetical protein